MTCLECNKKECEFEYAALCNDCREDVMEQLIRLFSKELSEVK